MKIKLDASGNVIERKSRTRHRPTSGTVTPDNRMRTDTLKQIQRDNYVSAAGVDYCQESVDELLRIRLNKVAKLKHERELREYNKLEKLREQGKLADESTDKHRVIEFKEIEDLLF